MEPDFVCKNDIIKKMNNGDETAFKHVFHCYYDHLCRFSAGYTGSVDLARDIVQDVFVALWETRESLSIQTSLKTYLFQAVKNRSINALIKNQRTAALKKKYEFNHTPETIWEASEPAAEPLPPPDVDKIWAHVYKLPEKRQTVFTLHRKHGLSYKEIAAIMGITRKTVENQMGKALKYLRSVLSKDQFV